MSTAGNPPLSSIINGVKALRLQVADEVLNILEHTRHTSYRHDVFIDQATGTYDVDCSGFVEYVLERFAPNHLDRISGSEGETRLLAHDFEAFFASLPTQTAHGWRQILDLRDARRGDLVAWMVRDHPPGDTGHVFFVAEQPVVVDTSGPTTMAVTAYDSSDILHYADSRGPGPHQFKTGVGSGILRLQVDSDGRPVAYQFGPGDPIEQNSRIAIARLEPFDR